jgi:cell pole-organizing protein PopZ
MSASEEAASALERAIAALRAGQLPTSPIFSYEPPPFTPQAEPEFAAQAEATPEAGAELTPVSEPAYEPEREPEFTLTEFEAEMVAQEPAILEVVVSEPEPEADRSWKSAADRGWEPEVPSWVARERAQPEPEYPAQRTNGGNHQSYAAVGGEAGPKSLEDSVKDMLRPMLQRWLDENMTRVLTAALKDELRDNPARFDTD